MDIKRPPVTPQSFAVNLQLLREIDTKVIKICGVKKIPSKRKTKIVETKIVQPISQDLEMIF